MLADCAQRSTLTCGAHVLTLVLLILHRLALFLILCLTLTLSMSLALFVNILKGRLALIYELYWCLSLVNILHGRLTLFMLIKLYRPLMFSLFFFHFPQLSSLNFIKTLLSAVSLVFRLR